MNDATKLAIVGGIIIPTTLTIVNMAWAWFLNRKTIQATLQAAHPAPKPNAKVKTLTVTQRRIIKRLHRIQGFDALTVVIGLVAIVAIAVDPIISRTWAILLVAYVVFGFATSVYNFIQNRSMIRRVKANDRALIKRFKLRWRL